MVVFIAREIGVTPKTVMRETLIRKLNSTYDRLLKLKCIDKLDSLLSICGEQETREKMRLNWVSIIDPAKDKDSEEEQLSQVGEMMGQSMRGKIKKRKLAQKFLENKNE